MISITEKLFVTKEINDVLLKYAKEVLLKDFLTSFCFPKELRESEIIADADTLSEIQHQYMNGYVLDFDLSSNIQTYISEFLSQVDNSSLTSLYFLLLNENYMEYFDEMLDMESIPEQKIDYQFGRELAAKLYHAETSGLAEELNTYLYNVICNFSTEFDLSAIDANIIGIIREKIDSYCE